MQCSAIQYEPGPFIRLPLTGCHTALNLTGPALIPIVMTLFPTSDVFKYLPSNGWFPICRNYKYVSPLNVLTFLGSYIYSTNLSICLLHPDHPSSLSSIQCLPYQPTQSIYPAHNLLY